MTTFLLLRHGQVDAIGRYLAGRTPGEHLNALGRQQVEELAWRLRDVAVNAIISSPLERTVETAKPLARDRGLEVELMDEFIEVDLGAWTLKPFVELDADEGWRRYNLNRSTSRAPGGESMFEVQQRAVRGLFSLVRRYPDGRVIVVSHGDVLRSMLLYALGIPIDFFHRLDPLPAKVHVVELGDGLMPRVLVVNGDGPP